MSAPDTNWKRIDLTIAEFVRKLPPPQPARKLARDLPVKHDPEAFRRLILSTSARPRLDGERP